MSEAKQSDSTAELGGLPEPVGFRSRYRSEPGMIGHYPWTYADQRRRKYDRPECEYEDLFTAEQLRAAVAAERERWEKAAAAATEALEWHASSCGEDSVPDATVEALDLLREASGPNTDDEPRRSAASDSI